MDINQYLTELNAEQQRVANVGPGLIAVSGCPGSGKTRSIVARIARMVRDGFDPQYILAMTFTRQAATVMNSRLASLGITGARVGTIHGLCYEFLQAENPSIQMLTLDTGNGEMSIKRVVSMMRQKKMIPYGVKVDIGELSSYVARCKASQICHVFGNPFGTNILAEKYHLEEAKGWIRKTGLFPRKLYDFYCQLDAHRAREQEYSFDDMVLFTWMHLMVSPEVLARWRQRWSVIITDEAQDSSPIQYDLAFVLAGLGTQVDSAANLPTAPKLSGTGQYNLMIATDTAQSIYAFRSAVPEISVAFATSKDTLMITLPRNYRSVPEICDVGSLLVKGEEWHLTGDMEPQREAQPGPPPVTFRTYDHPMQEAETVIQAAKVRAAELGKWSGVALLSRLAAILHLAEMVCIRNSIPYIKRASGSFLDSQEVTDILSYIRVAADHDPEERWIRRCVKRPFKYISRVQMQEAEMGCGRGTPYLVGLFGAKLGKKQRSSLLQMRDTIFDLKKVIEKGDLKPGEMCKWVVKKVKYLDYLREDRGSAGLDSSKLAIIDELAQLGNLFDEGEVDRFLTYIDQMNQALRAGRKQYRILEKDGKSTSQDCLVLSTIHRSKGMEWDSVFILDVVQGRFPWNLAHTADEELRLMYVAFTRGMNRVQLSRSMSSDDVPSSLWKKVSSGVKKVREANEKFKPSGKTEESPPKGGGNVKET